jgi:hypothetical protein
MRAPPGAPGAARVRSHDHAFLVYERDDELRRSLVEVTRAAQDEDALVVFVHAFPTEADALAWLDEAKPTGLYYRDAFEGKGPAIDLAHVDRVVEGILARAEKDGRKGATLFVDSSKAYLASGRADEWFRFEAGLGARLHHRVGLVCAYRFVDVEAPARRAEVLRTHAYRFG